MSPAKLKAGLRGGSILALLLSPLPGDVNLSTSGGDVKVKVFAEPPSIWTLKTSGSDVRCDLPVTVQGKLENSRIKGTVNSGGTSS